MTSLLPLLKMVSCVVPVSCCKGELEKTEQYLTDLKPACVNGDSKYEDTSVADGSLLLLHALLL